MKNKLMMIGSIALLSFVFILGLLRYGVSNNLFKLRADISYPTSEGVMISCNSNNISVGQSTTCYLTGFYSGGVLGVTGKITITNGVSISDFKAAEGMKIVITEDNVYDGFVINALNAPTPTSDQFQIATFTVTGVSEGTSTLTATGNQEEQLELTLPPDFSAHYVSDATTTITVSNGSEPEPEKSTDNTLSSLKMDSTEVLGNLNQTVPSSKTSVNITATKNDSKATVSGDVGTKSLRTGLNTFNITVTAESGAVRTYTLNITREPEEQKSSISSLSSLTASGATLIPTFTSTTTNYSAVVANTVSSVNISATPTDSKATVTGDTGAKSLQVGSNIFIILVTAEDGVSKTTYTITIEREEEIDPSKSDDNKLKNLAVSNSVLTPEFDKDTTEYTATLDSEDIDTITITATPNDSKAKVEGSGEKTLEVGSNTFNIVVTAENNSKKIYTITVVKASKSCELILASDIYKVDNQNLTINNVNRDHSLDVIKGNLRSDCGTFTVTQDKVVLSDEIRTKEYTINRVWLPQTGQKVIKYFSALFIFALAVTGLIIYKKRMDK